MAQPRKPRPAPVSVRLNREQCEQLKRDAGGRSINSHIIWRLFDPASPPPRSRRRPRGGDVALLTALLAKLGQSKLPNNLNQLAKAVHSGSLVLTPDIEAELHRAAADIAAMRAMLVAALGLADSAP